MGGASSGVAPMTLHPVSECRYAGPVSTSRRSPRDSRSAQSGRSGSAAQAGASTEKVQSPDTAAAAQAAADTAPADATGVAGESGSVAEPASTPSDEQREANLAAVSDAAGTPADAPEKAGAQAAAAYSPEAPTVAPYAPIGRIPVVEVSPVIEDGRWAAKATVGEALPIRATVFREGHDLHAATAVLIRPDGSVHSTAPMKLIRPGLDRYEGWVVPDAPGAWRFRVEGWSDPYGTWAHDAEVKIAAGVDVDLMLTEGGLVLERAVAMSELSDDDRRLLTDALNGIRDTSAPVADRLSAGTSWHVRQVMARTPLRDWVSPSAEYPLWVDRTKALYGSWYEIFPRSAGAFQNPDGSWVSGTLDTAAEELERVAVMGFDVIYLTHVHPIGTTNRKGRNNTLTAQPGDPGSPYGIGAEDGGHDAVHAELGGFAAFDRFVAKARSLDLEVALDIALQCSPDHPWAKEHPEWFNVRADGTIAYAENPPKKYQDIYPLNFDIDPEGLYVAIRDMLEVWVDHGVTLFRVDNPHTKPLNFWQRLLAEFREKHPEVIFLAEAFTRPAMMRTLGAIGFHQSYTYFTWRTEKEEIAEYLLELAYETDARVRPAFWPTTHDILTPQMQSGGVAAFAIRAVLAATGAPTWGIYSGYELVENVARPGVEEQIDNEKYEFKPRDWSKAGPLGIAQLITNLNRIRKEHVALQQLRNITIHPTTDDKTLAFSRRVPAHLSPTGKDDTILVVINLDTFVTRESEIALDLQALGARLPENPEQPAVRVRDLMSGETFWWGETPFVRLSPQGQCAHVLAVEAL